MLISKERIGLILARFSIVFPAPCPAEQHEELADIWHKVFGHIEERSFDAAALALMHTLKRFPCPADCVEALEAIEKIRKSQQANAAEQAGTH